MTFTAGVGTSSSGYTRSRPVCAFVTWRRDAIFALLTSRYPSGVFKQIEVSCDKENNPDDPYTHWNVESHWNDRCASYFSLPPWEKA